MSTVTAWPFLIARGRRRGYRVLAAPPFLVRQREEGFLEEVVGPPPGAVATRVVDSPAGRHLCLVWRDHQVRGADVGEPADPVDEHSRSLRLLYGFVCEDGVVPEPAPADLDRSRAAVLATYRRFLDGEEEFRVEESSPFPVAAHVAPATVPGSRRPRGLLAGAVVAVLLVVLAGVWWFASRPEQPAEPVVTVGRTVTGTIGATGEQDGYLLDTGAATRVAVDGARPRGLDLALHDAVTGDRVDLGPGGWTVEPNTRYRLTVTSARGEYTFRLVAGDR